MAERAPRTTSPDVTNFGSSHGCAATPVAIVCTPSTAIESASATRWRSGRCVCMPSSTASEPRAGTKKMARKKPRELSGGLFRDLARIKEHQISHANARRKSANEKTHRFLIGPTHVGQPQRRTRPAISRCPARRTTRTRARSSSSSARSRSG